MVEQGIEGGLLAVEHPRRALEDVEVDSRHLDHRSLRRQGAPQDGDPAFGGDGSTGRGDDVLLGGEGDPGQVLRQGPPGHREHIALE